MIVDARSVQAVTSFAPRWTPLKVGSLVAEQPTRDWKERQGNRQAGWPCQQLRRSPAQPIRRLRWPALTRGCGANITNRCSLLRYIRFPAIPFTRMSGSEGLALE